MTFEKDTDHLWHNGLYYGYPQCCIDNFIETYKKIQKRTDEQERAHMSTGFIPCHKHALEIIAGQRTLESLILPTRKHNRPFKSYAEKSVSRVTKQQ
jgi:hypothetical protein